LKKIEEKTINSSNVSDLECFIYPGTVVVPTEIDEKIQERIKIWSESERPVKWACVLTGRIKYDQGLLIPLVEDFYELPAVSLNEEHGLAYCLDDVKRIAEKSYIIAMLQLHPSNDLFPSSSDLAIALYTDLLLSRPILHIITNPKGEKLMLTFKECHECEHSFFKLFQLKKEKRR